ncbi:MAG: hypothetical protein H7308_11240 [Chthonomonadaceae bacterium]|nr:hypothetical protein [Chthonomonadaceae bacterium]
MNDPGFEIVKVTGERALVEMERLRNLFPQTGLYPVMLGQEAQIEKVLIDPQKTIINLSSTRVIISRCRSGFVNEGQKTRKLSSNKT